MYVHDTDNFIYIEYDDEYEIMKRKISRLDTSNYSVTYSISLVNKKVSG